jgi:hypothetical protein
VDFSSQIGTGIVVDTLLGPVLAGVSVGLDDGRWRTNFGIGRIFR